MAEAIEAGLQFEVVVGGCFGDGGYDGDIVALGADVVCGGDDGDVDVCVARLVLLNSRLSTITCHSCDRPGSAG